MAAEYAIIGAQVRTMDEFGPHARAVAWPGDGTGLTITPGLTDGHQHLLHGSELGRGAIFDRVASLSELRERVRTVRRRVGDGGPTTSDEEVAEMVAAYGRSGR